MNGELPEDDFGRELGDRLRRGNLADVDALDPQILIKHGRRRRWQRRIVAPVVTAVLVLFAAAGVYGIADRSREVPAPAGPVVAVPETSSAQPTATDSVVLDLDALRFSSQSGADQPPQVNIVQSGVWRPPLKDPVALSLPQGSRQVDYLLAGGLPDGRTRLLVHVGPSGREAGGTAIYTSSGQRTDLKIDGTDFTPGPKASVLWRDVSSHDHTLVVGRLNLDNSRASYEVPVKDPADASFVTAGGALFVTDGNAVTRYPIVGDRLGAGERLRDYFRVVSGNPYTDTVILASHRDGHDCSAVVDADTGYLRWWTCDYELTSQSGDGKYLYGHGIDEQGRGLGALFTADGSMILQLHGAEPPYASFDPLDRINVVVDQRDSKGSFRSAVVTCALTGCQLATAVRPVTAGSVPPYALVVE